ncbi:MAG: exo-alpha-sialidase [Candidatus Saccharibacteria bacterium]|nr:exo-alpha-sialidase [Moraxellaceae bacterium]
MGERDAVFACQGLLTRSRDGGQSWKKVFIQPQEQCKYLVQQANGTLWLAMQGQRGFRLYKSKDGGDNWTFFTDWSESEQGWQFGVDKAETVYVSGSEILRISNGGKKKEKFPRMNPFEKYDVYVSASDQIFLQGYHAIFIGTPPLTNIQRIHYASEKYLFKSIIDRHGNYFVNYGDGIMTVPVNEKRMIVDGTQNCIDERRSRPVTCNISQGFRIDAMSVDLEGNFYVAASSGLMRQKLN